MSDIKVRVGQTNAVKVVSSVASEGGRAVVAENVIGGIASVSYLDVSGISTFNSDVYIRGNLGIGTTNPSSKLTVGGDVNVSGILTATRIFSTVYGEFTGSVNANVITGTGLSISGVSTLSTVSVGNSFYYVPSYTNGVAYFNSSGLMVSTGSTNSNVEYTNYILTTDNSGIPIWSNVIDGGSY